VRRFDDTPIATLVAAAPDAAAAIARNVLGPILELPQYDRDTLLDTFETWHQCGGSLTESGARLYCHPNTVRYRLRKLAEHSGRSIDDPAAIGELNAALQAWRLIGDERALSW
jgi:DNA-binding PucR family transcriptional regulator